MGKISDCKWDLIEFDLKADKDEWKPQGTKSRWDREAEEWKDKPQNGWYSRNWVSILGRIYQKEDK